MAILNKVLPRLCFAVLLVAAWSISAVSLAHPLAPALLEIAETKAGHSEVLWKTPLAKIPGEALRPLLPADCRITQDIEKKRVDTATVEHWRVLCGSSWVGKEVGVQGLSGNPSQVIVRVILANGLKYQHILNAERPKFRIPERPRVSEVFQDYSSLGLRHILTGWDHLLFVLGLVLLVKGARKLLWTITAFTLGHSLTLSLAVLGWIRLPSAPVEALIALSILILAVELTRKQSGNGTFFHRYPWGLAFAFGLLHGLGFAGALAEVGLPVGEIPLALFSFNVGIEAGQIFFILMILGLQGLLKLLPLPKQVDNVTLPAYAIGSLAAFWFLERLAG